MAGADAVAAGGGVVDLGGALAAIEKLWSPVVVAEVNDCQVKAVKVEGEFVWHRHETSDEAFLVLAGELTIELRGRPDVRLGPGGLFVVPRGVEHRPVAARECHLLLIEPAGTAQRGDGAAG